MLSAETENTLADDSRKVRVLLIDDQTMVGEAVRRMLAPIEEIEFLYCAEADEAMAAAKRFKPTVILQDLVMPRIDGLTLVKQFRSTPETRDIPLVVLSVKEDPKIKAEAFALGANDYLVKLPDSVEMIARLSYHSNAYQDRLGREAAYRELKKSQERLAAELAEAAEYVRGLLPTPISGNIQVDWQFIPSTQLGGDSFGYHWLDDNHFAIYLLDVSGHGVGAALLSVSALNALRSGSLPNTDFRDPAEVMNALNRSFATVNQNGMFFTIWYGVYHKQTHTIHYASAGHPPAILISSDRKVEPHRLTSRGLIIGVIDQYQYESDQAQINTGDSLYLYSDGVYEVNDIDGKLWTLDGFVNLLTDVSGQSDDIQRIQQAIQEMKPTQGFEDDFSLLRVKFY